MTSGLKYQVKNELDHYQEIEKMADKNICEYKQLFELKYVHTIIVLENEIG